MYARSAYYQSGGAYGFETSCRILFLYFILIRPSQGSKSSAVACISLRKGTFCIGGTTKTEEGVRTKISDDLLWLPYVLSYYIKVTGDTSILKEKVYYIQSDLLGEKEHESYKIPEVSSVRGRIYALQRAIEKGYTKGERGISFDGAATGTTV